LVADVTSSGDIDRESEAGKVLVTGLSPVLSANSPTTFTIDTRLAQPAKLDVSISVCPR